MTLTARTRVMSVTVQQSYYQTLLFKVFYARFKCEKGQKCGNLEDANVVVLKGLGQEAKMKAP